MPARLSTGVAVSISGQWAASPAGKKQSNELQADVVRILGENDAAVRSWIALRLSSRTITICIVLSCPKKVSHPRVPSYSAAFAPTYPSLCPSASPPIASHFEFDKVLRREGFCSMPHTDRHVI